LSEILITSVRVIDLRFPTSREQIGSDAVNKDPDYSAAYCILETNSALEGHGLTFTLGRGTDLVVQAVRYLSRYVVNRTLSSITDDLCAFSRQLTDDSQFRWLGPEKGVIHLATGALINAVWDLYARAENKPLWQLLSDMEPAQLLKAVDFRYIDDAVSPQEALDILTKARSSGKPERLAFLEQQGYPAYTTSVGWFGYSEEKIRRLCHEALAEGWTHFKLKVGGDPANDLHRGQIVREEIGWTNKLMVDANQKWGVLEAIDRTRQLAALKPYWMEEPTSPDDILGHARIRREVPSVRIATGEHCHNRVMFKQLLQAQAIDVLQLDSCRVAGVNENLAILLLAAKFNIPVCPHAGGVGLCEYVQHLAIFDFLSEHFLTPVQIRRGHYLLPTEPGYSIQIREESLTRFAYPTGEVWSNEA
jgi:L-fuconate dehydratase